MLIENQESGSLSLKSQTNLTTIVK